jgi:hypothetical protein
MADPERQPRDDGDRWILPVGEGVVTQLQIDFAFGFTIEQWIRVRISEPFVVRGGRDPLECDPEGDPESMGRLVDLHQAVVTEASVYKDGSLRVEFADGRTLSLEAGAQYEAFDVTGSWPGDETFRLIALPGGGLAEWVDAP